MDAMRNIISDKSSRKFSEDALKESEERYRRLFENVPIGLYQTTLGLREHDDVRSFRVQCTTGDEGFFRRVDLDSLLQQLFHEFASRQRSVLFIRYSVGPGLSAGTGLGLPNGLQIGIPQHGLFVPRSQIQRRPGRDLLLFDDIS